MTRLQRNLWLLATVAFAVCLTVIALSYIVTEPWHIFPEIGGDGAKNGFTYLYHSAFGSGYWFEGMGYPYGEHIVFTDGIPLLSVLFATFGNVPVPVALTVLWWLVGLGYILSIVYMYKTLLRLGVTPLFAMIFAGIICIITPQWIRLRGHYALSITCFLPMLLYWSVAWQQERKLRYWVYVFVMGCIFSFIHPYYAGVTLIWVAAFCVGYLIFENGKLLEKVKQLVPPMIAGIGIPALVMTVMKLTDPATDRPTSPYIPVESYTTIRHVVTSFFSPFWEFAVTRSIVRVACDGGEGFSYIGLVPIAVLLFALPVYIYKTFQKNQANANPLFSPVLLFMAFGVLAFSMGVPLRFNIPWLTKYLFVFKQFRTLGRFAWIFYYIITLYSAVTVYQLFTRLLTKGKKWGAWSFILAVLLVWGYEAVGYMNASRKVADKSRYGYEMMFSVNEKKWTEFLKEHKLSSNNFQAILLLKFFHVGSDKIWAGEPGWLITLGCRASIQLHLPMIDAMMARSSLQRAEELVKTVAGPYADKPLLRDIKSNKPFLLLEYDIDSLAPDQKYLLEASDYIGEFSACRIYACYPDRIAANDKKHADSVRAIIPFMRSPDTCMGSGSTWHVAHYDNGQSKERLWGAGAQTAVTTDSAVLAVLPVVCKGDSEVYEYSCWFLVAKDNYQSPEVNLEMMDTVGNILKKVKIKTSEGTDNRDMWLRCSQYFYIPGSCRKIRFTITNWPNPAYIAMDEMMLRPAAATIICKGADGSVMVNNHLFKK